MKINLFGISGGKDSTALAIWAVRESGYDPASLRFTFCDTGNEDARTYEYIQNLGATLGIEITTLTNPIGSLFEVGEHFLMFPNPISRWCTRVLKIEPTHKYIKGLLEEGYSVISHAGSRAGESHKRRNITEWGEMNVGTPAKPVIVPVRYPFWDWNAAQVFSYLAKHGVEPNPLYSMGAERVGCYPCIMSKQQEIKKMPIDRIIRLAELEQSVNDGINKKYGTKDEVFTPFFPTAKTPSRYHDRTYKRKDGRTGTCASVMAVRQWAEERWAKSENLFEEEYDECPTEGGYCE